MNPGDGRLSELQALVLLAAAAGPLRWDLKGLGLHRQAAAASKALRRLVRRRLVRAWTRAGEPCPPGRRVHLVELTELGLVELADITGRARGHNLFADPTQRARDVLRWP